MSNKSIQTSRRKGRNTGSSEQDIYTNSPLNKILNWYNSQTDDRIITEFTNLTAYFHPDESMEVELKPERRKEKFREYLTISGRQRREIVRRSMALIGLIDLVLATKQKEEQTMGIHDIITVKWSDWSTDWKTLRNSSLMNEEISDWFFNSKVA